MPSHALALEPPSAAAAATRLRQPTDKNLAPVVARIEDDFLLLDARSVLPEQDAALIEAIRAGLAPWAGKEGPD
jgi:L-seryl-tRNA(Ser) seleniumtransferase